MTIRRGTLRVARLMVGSLWILAAATVVLTTTELVLAWLAARHDDRASAVPTPQRNRLFTAYQPFTIQYLHPQYLFFFPLDPIRRVGLSNEVCSIDADGFRGPGPSQAGARRLAFLLGGSSAFGHYASSDDTTITGYLNRLQRKYLFVNAGVPSWNSTQELFRLVFQIEGYHPDLVIAYDGANEAAILQDYGGRYPAGTPESFDRLAAFFDDIRGEPLRRLQTPFGRLFPQITRRLAASRHDEGGETSPGLPLSDGTVAAGVARHLANLRLMRTLVTAEGGRFLAVFQPVRGLHADGRAADARWSDALRRFHDALLREDLRGLDFHDFSALFDRHFASVPEAGGEIDESTLFVDEVHLYDPGNAIVARELWSIVCGVPAGQSENCG